MNTIEPLTQKTTNNLSQLLVFCLLFSLALHLLVIVAFTIIERDDDSQLNLQKQTVVRLVSPPPKKQLPTKDFELDHLPKQQQPQEKVDSFRKAEQNQKVIIEQAPKGNDVRDFTNKPPLPQQQPKRQILQNPNLVPKKTKPQQSTISKPSSKGIKPFRPASTAGSTPAAQLPTPTQLLPDQKLLQQIAQGAQAENIGLRNVLKLKLVM